MEKEKWALSSLQEENKPDPVGQYQQDEEFGRREPNFRVEKKLNSDRKKHSSHAGNE